MTHARAAALMLLSLALAALPAEGAPRKNRGWPVGSGVMQFRAFDAAVNYVVDYPQAEAPAGNGGLSAGAFTEASQDWDAFIPALIERIEEASHGQIQVEPLSQDAANRYLQIQRYVGGEFIEQVLQVSASGVAIIGDRQAVPTLPPAPFRVGHYVSEDGYFAVDVQPTYDGYFYVTATGKGLLPRRKKRSDYQHFEFQFNPQTRAALKIYGERYRFRTLSQEVTPERVHLVMQAGSRRTPHELHADFAYDPRSGLLLSLGGTNIISEFGLPDGSHWGRRKVIDHFPCSNLLAVAKPVDSDLEN